MSPSGWPKGKSQGPWSPERVARHVRRRRAKMLKYAALAAGAEVGGVGHPLSEQKAGGIAITQGAFRRATDYIGDSEFVDDRLDDCLLRALQNRLVYAGSVCTHHEPVFQDLTIEVIAATERHHMKLAKKGLLSKRRKRLLKPVKTRKVVPTHTGTGTPLVSVVDEMFPKSGGGRPLLEVVSAMFDS